MAVPAPTPALSLDTLRQDLTAAVTAVEGVLRGHPDVVHTVFAAILARGHVLLEDVPGVGKTTLARAVARALGTSFSRVQFTADLLPGDVIGVQVLEANGNFRFRPGPLFGQVVLADEINRASPKTQSAMLEAMSEGFVTVDDQSRPLPKPFLVIATQNPVEHHGAYPLPESQLDRFMVGLSVGYPGREEARQLVLDPHAPQRALDNLAPCLDPERVSALQERVDRVHLSQDVADYLLTIVDATRQHPDILLGCSPRGALAYAALARANAFLAGRDFVNPDDVRLLAGPVLAHRISLSSRSGTSGRKQALVLVDEIIAAQAVPR